jgi:hypothetical protein
LGLVYTIGQSKVDILRLNVPTNQPRILLSDSHLEDSGIDTMKMVSSWGILGLGVSMILLKLLRSLNLKLDAQG